MNPGLFDGVASRDEAIPIDRLILTAAALAAGHRGRDAVVEADLVLSHLKGKPERRRSAQQEAVRSVELVYGEYSQTPPKPSVIARWIKTAGGVEPLTLLLRQLGDSGHLDKGHAYTFAAVTRTGQDQPRQVATTSGGIKDGTELPTGLVWSTDRNAAVTRKEYEQIKGGQ